MENPYKLEDFYSEGVLKKAMKKARRVVEMGGAYMDGRAPDWLDIVDLDRLDLSRSYSCVFGQVFGPEEFYRLPRERGWAYAYKHGFAHEFGETGSWELLTQAWKEYIFQRRADARDLHGAED